MHARRPAPFHAFLVAIAILLLHPMRLEGQVPEPGARVRLTHVSGERVQGTLQELGADSARLVATSGTPVVVSLAEVRRIEVSLGRRREFWKHLGMTAMGLSAVGGVLAASSYEPCDEDVLFGCLLSPESRSEAFLWGALVGGVTGIPAGVVVGAAVKREQWRAVSQPAAQPVQVSFRPILGSRIGASATLRF